LVVVVYGYVTVDRQAWEVTMTEQGAAGGTPLEEGTPRVHPEEPAEGSAEGQHEGEEPSVPRRHTQEPAEGAEEPGEPR
jgi:hypothetical protein